MRTWRVLLGGFFVALGVLDLAFALWALSTPSGCGSGGCGPYPHGFLYGFGVFRLFFGVFALGIGSLMILSGLRSRPEFGPRWGPGPWGGPGGFAGPRRGAYGGPWGPGPRPSPVACPSCHAWNGPRFQYCRSCGTRLSPAGPPTLG